MMSIETISSDYRRRPVLTTLPTVESYAPEGSTITAGTVLIDSAPPDSDLKPGIFVTMLEWTSAARTMADPAQWTAIDEALRQHLINAVLTAVFSDAQSQQFHGTLALRLCREQRTERRDVGNAMTRTAVTLDDAVELESRVARLGQIHGPIMYVCRFRRLGRTLGKTPRSALAMRPCESATRC